MLRTMFQKNYVLLLIFSITYVFANPLMQRHDAFSTHATNTHQRLVNHSFSSNDQQTGIHLPFRTQDKLFCAGLNADITLHNNAGLVRVVLIDKYEDEYLLYETYSLLNNTASFHVQNGAIETKLLRGIIPEMIHVYACNASITIQSITYSTQPQLPAHQLTEAITRVKEDQNTAMIALINEQIKHKNMDWIAGKTFLSEKNYHEKKCYFKSKDGMLGNLQGFEYYCGGIFRLESEQPYTPTIQTKSAVIDSFDWRNRHGATNPQSPYYDGDTTGSGWATIIKSQGRCGSCWSFSTCGTIEMMLNLYYNKHLNYDLSEQYFLSCSCDEVCEKKGLPCSGGWSTDLTDWFTRNGVIEETAFPYKIIVDSINAAKCSDSLSIPTDHLYFKNYLTVRNINKDKDITPTEDSLKLFLIHHGPLNVEIHSIWHCMLMVGFTKNQKNGKTVWIFKNSWGFVDKKDTVNGNTVKGVSYFEFALNNFRSADALKPPVISKKLTDNDIQCLDKDKDGFYNWGIGPKPITCPPSPLEEDCDDSQAGFGPMEADGSCKPKTSIQGVNKEMAAALTVYLNISGKVFTIPIQIGTYTDALVSLYDAKGCKITSLLHRNTFTNNQNIVWNCSHENRTQFSSGVYFLKIDLSHTSLKTSSNTQKLILSH